MTIMRQYADPDIVHAAGITNPRWPLCHEADARKIGWTTSEIEDGELAFDEVLVNGTDTTATVDCPWCIEWMHA